MSALNAGHANLNELTYIIVSHDYLGRSTARGAFMLWTHNMKNISYHDMFMPAGAPVQSNVTLQKGESPVSLSVCI